MKSFLKMAMPIANQKISVIGRLQSSSFGKKYIIKM